MKKIFLYIFSLILLGLNSCDPCKNLDCASSNFYGQFRIVDKIDGKDLLFGSTKIYDKEKIKIYSVNSIDTTFYDAEFIKFGGTNYDSILYVRFYPQIFNSVFLKLSDTDTDTLTMTFKIFDTKCCGTITQIDKFLYNSLMQIPGDLGTQEIKK